MLYNKNIMLLKIISSDGSLNPLLDCGYTYSQVGLLIKKAITEELVELNDNIIKLTSSGNKMLEEYYENNKLTGSTQWIMPQELYYEKPMKVDEIVIPYRL